MTCRHTFIYCFLPLQAEKELSKAKTESQKDKAKAKIAEITDDIRNCDVRMKEITDLKDALKKGEAKLDRCDSGVIRALATGYGVIFAAIVDR